MTARSQTSVDVVLNVNRWRRLLAVFAASAFLFGCAAESAFRDGNALLAQGNGLAGLAKLEEASHLEPGSAEYKIAYLRNRDRYAQVLIERADAARASGQYEEAERDYRETLQVRALQDRALEGLRLLAQQRNWDAAFREAEQAVERKDWDAARGKLKLLLTERPGQDSAIKLLERVEQQTARPHTEPALANAYKQPITVEFRDVPLRNVFEVISRTSHLNFLFDKEVKTDQRVSIYLRNSTVEAAVNWLLLTNQLEQRVLDGSTVLVYPSTTAKLSEYQPLTVKSFYLANAEAKTVAATIKTLLKSNDIVVDEKLNLVILRDTPEAIRLAEKLVAMQDVPEPEVMLEVEVLEVTRDRLLDLGVRWPSQVSLSLLPAITGGTLTLQDLRNPGRASFGVTVGPTTLFAQKQDTDVKTLANPRIRTRNHQKASVMIGERLPNITTTSTATGFVGESINYIDVGLKLDVEPTIYLDNEVAIKISLEVSSITGQQTTSGGSVAYQIGTRNAQTVLRLKDGENQVLAGLINNEERGSANKVPGLGELPIIGRLFGEQSNDASQTEVVLSITPRILRNIRRPDQQSQEFASGTGTSLRSWPSDAGSASYAETSATQPTSTASQPAAAAVAQPGNAVASAIAAAPATLVATSSAGSIAGITQLRWEGPTQVRAGDGFTLQLIMQSERPLLSVPLLLGFDPKVLQVVSVSEGGFMKDGGSTTTFSQHVDPGGQVTIVNVRADKTTGATSPGVIATLSLRALPATTATETKINILSAGATSASGMRVDVPSPAPHSLTVVH